MDAQGLRQDAITCSSLISALAKGKQWALALQVCFIQQAHYWFLSSLASWLSVEPFSYTGSLLQAL